MYPYSIDKVSKKIASKRMRQAGVTMVEFALVMPVALLIVLGLVQIGLMYMAKNLVNTATFMAARSGAVKHAQLKDMQDAMTKALIPFYQDTSKTDANDRLQDALGKAQQDTGCASSGFGGGPCSLRIEILNPSPDVFADFAMTEGKQPYIPNDNLEYRSHGHHGTKTGLTIQDANVLKIKATYGYELKVPLMKSVIGAVMCGVDSGVEAFGKAGDKIGDQPSACTDFYSRGRVPIVSYATVLMQTAAYPNP